MSARALHHARLRAGASSGQSSGGRLLCRRQRRVDARECRLPGVAAGAVAPRDKVDGRAELGSQLVVAAVHDTQEVGALLPAQELGWNAIGSKAGVLTAVASHEGACLTACCPMLAHLLTPVPLKQPLQTLK